MHDAGPLPPPKEGGPMADMISYVLKAKEASDEYLTEIIETEKLKEAKKVTDSNNTKEDEQPEMKKAKNHE